MKIPRCCSNSDGQNACLKGFQFVVESLLRSSWNRCLIELGIRSQTRCRKLWRGLSSSSCSSHVTWRRSLAGWKLTRCRLRTRTPSPRTGDHGGLDLRGGIRSAVCRWAGGGVYFGPGGSLCEVPADGLGSHDAVAVRGARSRGFSDGGEDPRRRLLITVWQLTHARS